MDVNRVPVLCGGTFFTLLIRAANEGLNRRSNGTYKSFKLSNVFVALINVALSAAEDDAKLKNPNPKNTTVAKNFTSAVSAYKSCSKPNTNLFPIHDDAYIDAFTKIINDSYQTPLSAMNDFVVEYLGGKTKQQQLVRSLIELINDDTGITDTELLYVCQSGRPLFKPQVCKLTDICLPAFLLGIWHFIIVNKIDNTTGKATYDVWCPATDVTREQRSFVSTIGSAVSLDLNIFLLDASAEPNGDATIEINDDEAKEPYVEYDEPFTEQPESEPIIMQQLNIAPAVVVNQGGTATITQFNNSTIETINFGWGN